MIKVSKNIGTPESLENPDKPYWYLVALPEEVEKLFEQSRNIKRDLILNIKVIMAKQPTKTKKTATEATKTPKLDGMLGMMLGEEGAKQLQKEMEEAGKQRELFFKTLTETIPGELKEINKNLNKICKVLGAPHKN